MGKRVHVATKYKVEFECEGFNYKQDEVRNLMGQLGCDTYGDEFADDFECDTKQFDNALKFLQEHKEEIKDYDDHMDDFEDIDPESVHYALLKAADTKDFDAAYEYCVMMFEEWHDNRQKRDSYMHFSCF